MISLKIIFLNLINYLYSPQKKPGSSPAMAFSIARIYAIFGTFHTTIYVKIPLFRDSENEGYDFFHTFNVCSVIPMLFAICLTDKS